MHLDICRDACSLRSTFGARARDEALRRAADATAAATLHWRRVAVLLTAARA